MGMSGGLGYLQSQYNHIQADFVLSNRIGCDRRYYTSVGPGRMHPTERVAVSLSNLLAVMSWGCGLAASDLD
jgi:hypothetical protein